MKRIIAVLLSCMMIAPVMAADYAKLKLHISDPVKENKYFLCLYGIGCLSIRAGNHGKVYPIMPDTDIGNIRKIVVTDVSNMSMHLQPSAQSCNIVAAKNQHITISGQLVVKNHTPYINNLHCTVT